MLRRSAVAAYLCLAGSLLSAQGEVWLDVPFIRQEKNACGAATIAMVMQYWQHQQGLAADADAGKIQRSLYSEKAHGIYASDLKNYLDQHGFRTFSFSGRWEDLREHLAKGRPLIVGLKPSGQSELHYVVVAGIDTDAGVVLVNDPGERKLLKRDRSTFEKEWRATRNWTLLAVPAVPEKPTSTN